MVRPVRGLPAPLRLLALALAVGGATGGVTSFLLLRDFWVWPMPDLAHRFLAAAAFAYLAGGIVALWSRAFEAQRMLMATVVIYGLPLVVAVLLDHQLIDWNAGITFAFLVIVSIAVAICAAYLPRRLPSPPGASPLAAESAGAAWLLAAVALIVGAIVFAAPKDSGWLWPWAELKAWKVLDTRLVASMLLTIGGAAAWVGITRSRAAAGVVAPMLLVYTLVASAGLVIHARRTPAFREEDWTYIAIFVLVATATAVAAIRELHRAPRRTA